MVNILGNISPAQFLADYWQSKPLLVRQAIRDFRPALDAQTLAGLALEEEVRARIVQETKSAPPWTCEYGPFDEEHFASLPASRWTLLVQDVEKHLPQHAYILDYFSFLPRWRIEDLMVSYAVDEGSVGPHTDRYDVFLLQAAGKRKWQLQLDNIDESALIENIDLQILKDFTADEEWILEPGDMLYLPPGIAHYGIALGESMTFSIGFRAPSQIELLQAFTERYSMDEIHPQFYTDRVKNDCRRSELQRQDVLRMQQLLMQTMENEDLVISAIGQLLTHPANALSLVDSDPVEMEDFIQMLSRSHSIKLHPASRCVYIRYGGNIDLYFNGSQYHVGAPAAQTIMQLCDNFQLPHEAIKPILSDRDSMDLLHDIYQQGYMYLEDNDA
jgi:50S ribosomal protein L16 3-hydroxylase